MTDRTWHWRVGDRCEVVYVCSPHYGETGTVDFVHEYDPASYPDDDVRLNVRFLNGDICSYFWNYEIDTWEPPERSRMVRFIEPVPGVALVQLELPL